MSTKGQTPTSLIRTHLEGLRAEVERDEQELAVRERKYMDELRKLNAEVTAGRAEVAKFEAWLAKFGEMP